MIYILYASSILAYTILFDIVGREEVGQGAIALCQLGNDFKISCGCCYSQVLRVRASTFLQIFFRHLNVTSAEQKTFPESGMLHQLPYYMIREQTERAISLIHAPSTVSHIQCKFRFEGLRETWSRFCFSFLLVQNRCIHIHIHILFPVVTRFGTLNSPKPDLFHDLRGFSLRQLVSKLGSWTRYSWWLFDKFKVREQQRRLYGHFYGRNDVQELAKTR